MDGSPNGSAYRPMPVTAHTSGVVPGTDPAPKNGPSFEAHAVAVLALMILGFGVTIAATVTNVYTVFVSRGSIKTTFWMSETCLGSACRSGDLPDNGWCTELQVRFEAMQAFSIILILLSLVGAAVAAGEVLKKVPAPAAGGALTFYWLWLLIQFAVIAGTYHNAFCQFDSLSDRGQKMSVSFALYLCLWFLTTFVMLFYYYRHLSAGL